MPNLRGWLIHTVTRSRRSNSAVGSKGDPVWGPQTTFKARCEKTTKVVRTPNGREVIASHVLATDAPVSVLDRFWLPSIAGEPGDNAKSDEAARAPLSVEVATDKAGRACLFRVYFA